MNRRRWAAILAIAVVMAGPVAAADPEATFLAENQAAMDKMMAGMSVAPTGDIDRDFALSMIPHHQGAIDMAEAELRHGHNEQLRRIAQEIVIEQQQEIAAMRLAVEDLRSVSISGPTTFPICTTSNRTNR